MLQQVSRETDNVYYIDVNDNGNARPMPSENVKLETLEVTGTGKGTGTSASTELTESANLDAVLIQIGQFGRFQLMILLLISFPMMFNAIFSVTYVFTASAVTHRCVIPECDTESSVYDEPYTEWAIPSKNNDLDKCSRFIYINDTDANVCKRENFQRNVTEDCKKGDYVYKDKEITVANEFGIFCDDEWKLALVGTMNNIGQFVGIPLGGFISDRYGRTTSLALSGFMSGLIGLVRSFAPNYEFFLVFEFLDTMLSGTLYSTCFIVGIELVGPKRRVVACSLITIFYGTGEILLAVAAKYLQNWRTVLRVLYTPAILQGVFFWILPESVRWLLSQGKEERAKQLLRRAAQINKHQLSEDVLEQLIINNRNQLLNSAEDKYPIVEAFTKLRWRIINCSICWIVNVLVYYGISLNSVLLPGDKYVNFMLTALVEIPGLFCPYILMDRLGRRYSLCSLMIVSGLCCLATVFISADSNEIQLILFLVGKFTISASFQVLYFFTSEIFPTNLRNSLLSFCSMVGRVGSMIAPQTPLLAKYDPRAPAFLFAVTALFSGVLSLFFPETTNIILPANMLEADNIKKSLQKTTDL